MGGRSSIARSLTRENDMRASSRALLLAIFALGFTQLSSGQASAVSFSTKALVSDGFVVANHTDLKLVNPWGIAFNPSGLVWVADNGTDVSTLYDGKGTPSSLVVSIPKGAPTGIVFNGSKTDFALLHKASPFIFATEKGVIAAWAPAIDPNNAQVAFSSKNGAIYKGLAIAGTPGRFLYAADFHNNRIDVFNASFKPHKLPGDFSDPKLPAGYAPFNIVNINGVLYVAYAKQGPGAVDEVAGPGNGFVDVFTANGTLIRRLVTRGKLNAPWGLVVAPAGFGGFGGRLLVGNFGDGAINAYNLATGAFLGSLKRPDGSPLRIDGLWGLAFGNGVLGQSTRSLFFAAGPADEQHGVYGRINAIPATTAAGADAAADAAAGQ